MRSKPLSDDVGGLHEIFTILMMHGAHEAAPGASDAEGERGNGQPTPSTAKAVRGP